VRRKAARYLKGRFVSPQCLEEFLADEWEEPWRGCRENRPSDMASVVDGEESDAFRFERPTLAIGL
jgi:hypothetical protein